MVHKAFPWNRNCAAGMLADDARLHDGIAAETETASPLRNQPGRSGKRSKILRSCWANSCIGAGNLSIV
jgi:hypothetical protein